MPVQAGWPIANSFPGEASFGPPDDGALISAVWNGHRTVGHPPTPSPQHRGSSRFSHPMARNRMWVGALTTEYFQVTGHILVGAPGGHRAVRAQAQVVR